MRHGIMPPGVAPDEPIELSDPIDFTHPDFAMTVRMENSNAGISRFFLSYDRGHAWRGPFRLPLFGQIGVMGRTDMIVNGPSDCLLFLTASKKNGLEGRPFCRTNDRRRAQLAVPFVHRPGTNRVLDHAFVGAPVIERPRDDGPAAR